MSSFDEVVKQIDESEKNVDKVLKAARLDRHEKTSISTERLRMILDSFLMSLGMILIFAFFFMLFYLCR